jgi:hypothetical protein
MTNNWNKRQKDYGIGGELSSPLFTFKKSVKGIKYDGRV